MTPPAEASASASVSGPTWWCPKATQPDRVLREIVGQACAATRALASGPVRPTLKDGEDTVSEELQCVSDAEDHLLKKTYSGAIGYSVMGDPETAGEGPRCVGCGRRVKTLFVQYSPGNIRLMKCDNCKAVADPYIECEFMIILIDLILHKTRAYRHLLFNKLAVGSSLDKVLGDALLGNIIFMVMLLLGIRFILKLFFDITSPESCDKVPKSTWLRSLLYGTRSETLDREMAPPDAGNIKSSRPPSYSNSPSVDELAPIAADLMICSEPTDCDMHCSVRAALDHVETGGPLGLCTETL